MNILKSILFVSVTCTATALLAQAVPVTAPATAPATNSMPTVAQLKAQAQNPMLLQMLEGPDGAMIKSSPEGYFTVFAVGTGTYDFNDPEDKVAAQKIAVLQAKAHLAKYIKEKLSVPESLSEEMTKAKSLSKNSADKNAVNSSVSKEFVTKMSQFIESHAEELLQGVITLQSKDVQLTEGGTCTVLLCTSPKTRMVAQELHDDIEANVNGLDPAAEDEQPAAEQPAPKEAAKPKVIIRNSMSEF